MVLSADIAARSITDDYEIIVVNDGSSDHTALMLAELEKLVPCLRVITHPQNLGYGAALRTGISTSAKEWVFYTDGDAQYNPLEMPKLVEAVRENVDVVNGYKISRNDPLIRIILPRMIQTRLTSTLQPIRVDGTRVTTAFDSSAEVVRACREGGADAILATRGVVSAAAGEWDRTLSVILRLSGGFTVLGGKFEEELISSVETALLFGAAGAAVTVKFGHEK